MVPIHPGRPVIEGRALRKSYGVTTAVDGVDIDVGAGEVTAVVGPNGAGKTTLLEMLLGLVRPDSGSVRVFGGEDPASHRVVGRIGAMLQECRTPPALTVAETVGLVRRYYPRALEISDVLVRADLAHRTATRAARLSGGEQQRLSFALAIVGAPDLVLLDEPTAALDVEARHAFWCQIRSLAEDGMTVVFASHRMVEIEAFADRVVVVHRGRIVADGSPADIAGTVATRVVEVTTDVMSPDHLPGVVRAEEVEPGRVRLTTTCAEETVRSLYATGAAVHRLIVHDADMETAFRHLTRGAAEEMA